MKSVPATRFKPAGPKYWTGLGTLPQRERLCAAFVSLDIILSIFLSLSDAGNLVKHEVLIFVMACFERSAYKGSLPRSGIFPSSATQLFDVRDSCSCIMTATMPQLCMIDEPK